MEKIISNILNKSGYQDIKPLYINGEKSDYYAYITWHDHHYRFCFCDENLNKRTRPGIGIPEGTVFISVLDDGYHYGSDSTVGGILVNAEDCFVKTFIPKEYGEKAFLVSPLIIDGYDKKTPSHLSLGEQGFVIDGKYCLYSLSLNNCHFFISSNIRGLTRYKKDSPEEYHLLVIDNNGNVLFSQQSSFVFVWCFSDGNYYIVNYEKGENIVYLRFSTTGNYLITDHDGYIGNCNSVHVYVSHYISHCQDAFRPKRLWLNNNYCDCTDKKLLIYGEYFFSIIERKNRGYIGRLLDSEVFNRPYVFWKFLSYKYSNDILRFEVDIDNISSSGKKKHDEDFLKEWKRVGAYLLCDMKANIFAEQKYGGITYIPYNYSLPKKCGVLTEEHTIMIPFVYDEIIGLDGFYVESDTKKEYKRLYVALTGANSDGNLYDNITLYLNEKELISLDSCGYHIIDNKYVQLKNESYNVLYHYKGILISDEFSHIENGDKLFQQNPRLIQKLSSSFEELPYNYKPNILEIRDSINLRRRMLLDEILQVKESISELEKTLYFLYNKELQIIAGDCYNFDKKEQERELEREREILEYDMMA